MRTFKKIGLVLILVALGLTLVGCRGWSTDVVTAPAGEELTILTWGDESGTSITITGDHGKFITLSDNDAGSYELDDLSWSYELPEGSNEYLVVHYFDGDVADAEIHLLASKKPPELDK